MAYNGTERRAEPLTEEQLNLIGAETQHAAAKVLKRYSLSAVVGFLILLGTNVFVWGTAQNLNQESRDAIVVSGKVVSIEGCNRDFQTISALRGVLTAAQRQGEKAADAGDISPAQLERSRDFYDTQLKKLRLPDCKVAGEILTADKDELPRVPTPLRPK